ncbi:hypothetical protein [Rhizobium sp. Leaf383]|nr:hypothetical protein [Rhizobium sp. Leaf383]KQS77323.1 hypothetical protein ASG58_10035 [Rhizobium sp. Leaf383]KQY48452.1 hypothetical protein ASD32_10220 [Rhizobium sp. Root483D2]
MTTLLSADALRVARTLAGLSQREVASQVAITQKAVWIAENTDQLAKPTNAKLRTYYETLGIEFLGTIDLRAGLTTGLGARWRTPYRLPVEHSEATDYHTERTGIAFVAARALLNRKQSEIANDSGMAERKIGQLEAGLSADQESSLRLRSFYERERIAFLGWGDVTSGLYYGVGVKWQGSN